MNCLGCQHFHRAKLTASIFQGLGWCYLPKVFPTGVIVSIQGECDQRKRQTTKQNRFVEKLKAKLAAKKEKVREAGQQERENKWLSTWVEHPELRNTFSDYDDMKSFANTYGYRKKDVAAMIRHKKVKEEMMRT